jgi:hypothetical protein
LWTVKNATNGDVIVDTLENIILFRKIGNNAFDDVVDYHCVIFNDDMFDVQDKDYFFGSIEDAFFPATKEQRERLFKKIKENNYVWDSEEKRLSKDKEHKPKFKVGDFIVNDYCMGKVIELTNDAYLLDTEQGIPFSCEHNVHLWTIQDAKDGDVLCVKYGNDEFPFIFTGKQDNAAYCALNSFGEFVLSIADWLIKTSVLPATKEQHDLLFSKMKEAGYEWDAENKVLSKIEKQGEQKPNPYTGTTFEYNGHTWGMCARDNGVEILFDGELKAFLSSEKSFIYPIHPQPSLIPKFKVGDWITDGNCKCQITFIDSSYWYSETCVLGDVESINNTYHLWTIKDVKDGDVLQLGGVTAIFQKYIGNGNCRCYCSVYNGEFEIPSQDGADNSYGCVDAIPATKEQHDLLFSNMKEAGYEWDAEKKELRKIKKTSKWTEEDERFLNDVDFTLFQYKDMSKERYWKIIDWIKSLKQRMEEQQ